jgi:hypothetical protein
MRDKDGNQIQGGQVVYFIDGGKVEIKGKSGLAAPPATAATPPATDKPSIKPNTPGREGSR